MGCYIQGRRYSLIRGFIWECPFARNVWALVKGKVQKCSNEIQDFFHLFGMLVEKLTRKELEPWAAKPRGGATA